MRWHSAYRGRTPIRVALLIAALCVLAVALPLSAQASGGPSTIAPLIQNGQQPPAPGSLPSSITIAPLASTGSSVTPAAAAICSIDPGDQWVDSGTKFEYWALLYCTSTMPLIQVKVCYDYFTPGHAGIGGFWSALAGCESNQDTFTGEVQATGTVDYEFVGDPYRDYGSGEVTPPAGYYCSPSCSLGAYGPEI